MKPLFVSMNEGRRVVHWPRLAAFAVVVLIVTTGVVEALWWLLAHTLSVGALVVALVLGTPIVIRAVVRAISYQEQELEMTVEP
jgi:hypothetical protein